MTFIHYNSLTRGYWPGYNKITKLFIFGDSYTTVGYDTGWPAPTPDEPLGVPFPGYTFTEGGEIGFGDSHLPNWVGHLVKYRREAGCSPMLVYNYAVGGHSVKGGYDQINNWFLPHVGKKPDWAPWASEESLFITWFGINDCAGDKPNDSFVDYFEQQEILYEAGARNFMFIDVPPVYLAPWSIGYPLPRETKYFKWNLELRKAAEAFQAKHHDITVLIYSSWNLITKVLEAAEVYGFRKSDCRQVGGIWWDHLHITSKMHDVLTKDMIAFLEQFQEKGRAVEEE